MCVNLPFNVFPFNEQLVVSPEFDEGVEIAWEAVKHLARVVLYLHGDYGLLHSLQELRVKACLLLGEYGAKEFVIDDLLI